MPFFIPVRDSQVQTTLSLVNSSTGFKSNSSKSLLIELITWILPTISAVRLEWAHHRDSLFSS